MTLTQEGKAVRDVVTGHFAKHRFDEGVRILQEQGSSLPEAVRLECSGNLHFYRREMQAAIRCYEAAIKKAPDHAIARYQYLVGTQEERQQNFVEAFKRYQNAIDAEPTFIDPYVELGGLLVKVGDFEGALQCYRDSVRLEPLDLANHHNLKAVLGRLVQLDSGRYQEELSAAEAAYQKIAQQSASRSLADHQW